MPALDTLASSKRSQLIQACAGGECQLLLGAGASMDSRGADGELLPGAVALARQIEIQFGLASSDRDLREIVGRVLRRGLSDELYMYLHSRFSNTHPAMWYSHMTSLAWKRIWTLNIDDVLTQAWGNKKWSCVQQLRSYAWDDPFEEEDRKLQVVHLHGHVHVPNPTKLIFALIEYVEATTSLQRTWHNVFGDLWLQSPFIVVGAGLREEIDLARFLENRNRLKTQLAVYVVAHIDPDWREDLELWGLSVVEATAEDFFRELNAEVRPRQETQFRLKSVRGRAVASLVNFGQHFQAVQDLRDQARSKRHDLLKGDYPRFQDIADRVDLQFEYSKSLEKTVGERLEQRISGMLLVMGEPFSGKTLGIMRAAANLAAAGHATYWFRGEARPNARLVVEALESIGTPVVLVADDITPWAYAFADIVQKGRAKGQVIIVIGAARAQRLPILVSSIPMAVWNTDDIFHSSPPTRKDAKALDELLDSSGRLNHLQRVPEGRRIRYILDEGVFSSLYRAQGGPQFRERLGELYQTALRPDERRLAFLAALLSEVNLAVPMSVAWMLVPDLHELEGGRLLDIFDVGGGSVRLRSRAIALDYLRTSTGRDEVGETIMSTLRALRRSVNEVTIRSGSDSAEIMKSLLRARFLHRQLGPRLASELIEQLQETYGWDGGYWEQRAIDARLRHQWGESEGFAAKAAEMLDDDHRNTTMGSVLMDRAAFDSTLVGAEVFDVAERGVNAFSRAVLKRRTNPVPILTCLSGLTGLVQRRTEDLTDAEIVRIQGWWGTWFQRGRQLKAFAIGELDQELEQARRDWDTAMVVVLEPGL